MNKVTGLQKSAKKLILRSKLRSPPQKKRMEEEKEEEKGEKGEK